jgi:hypothetical protein
VSDNETPPPSVTRLLDAVRTGEDDGLDILPTGADIRVAGGPLRLSDEAATGAINKAREMLPSLPQIPQWFWLLGAAFWGSLAYGAWRVLKATAPVLVPAALGLPPGTTMALRAAMQPSSGAPPRSDPRPQLPPAAPLLEASPASLQAISTTMSARGRRSGTSDMLAQLAANVNLAGPSMPDLSAPSARASSPSASAAAAPFGITGLEQVMAPITGLMASRGRRSRTADAVAMLAAQPAATPAPAASAAPTTMEKVKDVVTWLRQHPDTYTAAEVAEALGFDELTARRALKLAVDSGLLHAFKNGEVRTATGAA